jgi:hypothetical protein
MVRISDLIGEYLNELRASLRLAQEEAEMIAAEAEDHLRTTALAALAAGMKWCSSLTSPRARPSPARPRLG